MVNGELDSSSGVPLYRQIKDILREEVTTGAADDAEPMTEAQLLARFDVSRAPIRQALQELATEGYVYRKQGKGTFPVTGARVQRPAEIKPGALHQFLSESGLHPSSKVSGMERVVPPGGIRELLRTNEREELLHFRRVISVEGEPIAEADVYVRTPESFDPTTADLEASGSTFALLETEYGITLDREEHAAWASAASAEHEATLGIPEGSPLLVIETVFFTTGGRPAGWRLAVHLAEDFKYRFATSWLGGRALSDTALTSAQRSH